MPDTGVAHLNFNIHVVDDNRGPLDAQAQTCRSPTIGGMETFRMTDKNDVMIATFEVRNQGEAIVRANEIDQVNGLSDTTLWIEQHNGDWLAV